MRVGLKLIQWTMIKVTKRVHNGWIEWEKIRSNPEFQKQFPAHPNGMFGKWQYIYSSDKGEISLVQLLNYSFDNNEDVWEIYELSANKLFEDVKRFRTKKQAEKRIKELLK